MKHLKRRLTALLLVLAMVMSLAATATAAEESSSAEESSVTAQQEVDPGADVQDLDEATSEQQEEEESSQEDTGEAEESAQEAPEEDAEESSEKAAEADEVSEDDEASEDVPQEETIAAQAGTGWSVNGESITLTYDNGNAVVKAVGGLFAVPAQELDVNGSTWSFGEGVYEFDNQGNLVVGPYTAIEETSIVNALNETLSQTSNDERTLDIAENNPGTTIDGTTVTPGAALRSRVDGSTYYYQGLKYTGYFRSTAKSALMEVRDGTATEYSGQMVMKPDLDTYLVNFESVTGEDMMDFLWYYKGKVYTGFFRNSEAEFPDLLYGCVNGEAELYGGLMKKKKDAGGLFKTYLENNEPVNKFDELWYVEGEPFTGWYENVKTKVVYLLNEGEIVKSPNSYLEFYGLMEEQTINGVTYSKLARNNEVQPELDGKYYQGGKLLTGVPSVKPTNNIFPKLHMYSKGVKQTLKDGWYKKSRPADEFWQPYVYYYFKNNEAIHGKENVKLKAIKSGTYTDNHSYYYTFDKIGHLVTNLVEYYNKKDGNYKLLKNGKFRIFCDHTNYTGTILMYNSKDKKNNGGWNIPVKSFVISMSKSKSYSADPHSTGTKYGDYALASGSSGFYKYKSPKGNISYFSSSRHIWGSGSMFHGAAYKKANRKYMMASSYNRYGKNQTQHCVRVQNINMALITKMYNESSGKKKNNGRWCTTKIRVILSKSNKNNHMPFGQMTLKNNCDFNGYILENANAYGNGKDMSFDPTDHNLVGTTIYVANKKTSKKADCQKVKMYKYAGYSVYYKKA